MEECSDFSQTTNSRCHLYGLYPRYRNVLFPVLKKLNLLLTFEGATTSGSTGVLEQHMSADKF